MIHADGWLARDGDWAVAPGADNDTFGVLALATLSAAALADKMRQMRPMVEHDAASGVRPPTRTRASERPAGEKHDSRLIGRLGGHAAPEPGKWGRTRFRLPLTTTARLNSVEHIRLFARSPGCCSAGGCTSPR
jgi:hypothetical protein